MTQALTQAMQAPDVLERLQALQFHVVIDQIALHSLAAVVTMGCAILLFRTAAGTLHSRFLRHLAASVSLDVLFRLGSIMDLLLKAGLSFLTLSHVSGIKEPAKEPLVGQVGQVLATLDSTWHGIDITISLLGTWFLITTWDLLKNYPKENVDRSLYTSLTSGFGLGILGVLLGLLNLAEKLQTSLWHVLDFIDVIAATLGLLLIGWQIQKTLGSRIKTKNGVVRGTLPWATAFLYFIWGGIQPFYPWLKDSSWYSVFLLMGGVSAILMTLILCSQALEEKPEYQSAGERLSQRPPAEPEV